MDQKTTFAAVGPATDDKASPTRAPKAAERVAAQIRKLVIQGDLAPGDRLPPEAQLIARFASSRATVREAMLILEAEQFLTVQQGSRRGALICRPPLDSPAPHARRVLEARGATIAEVYHLRLAVEPYAAWLIATRRSDEAVATLRAELSDCAALQARGDDRGLRVALERFHRVLVNLAGSDALSLAGALFQDVILRHKLRLVGLVAPHEACDGLKSFVKLVDLIERGEAERAQSHWRQHIRTTLDRWVDAVGDQTLLEID